MLTVKHVVSNHLSLSSSNSSNCPFIHFPFNPLLLSLDSFTLFIGPLLLCLISIDSMFSLICVVRTSCTCGSSAGLLIPDSPGLKRCTCTVPVCQHLQLWRGSVLPSLPEVQGFSQHPSEPLLCLANEPIEQMAAIRHQRWRARLVYMQTFVSHHLWNEWRLWAPRAGACLWGVPDAWGSVQLLSHKTDKSRFVE